MTLLSHYFQKTLEKKKKKGKRETVNVKQKVKHYILQATTINRLMQG